MFRSKLVLLVCVAAAVHCQTSFAAIITYSSRAAWQAAVGSFSTENFNSIVSDTAFTNSSLVFPDLTLRSSGGASGNVLIDLQTYEFNPGSGDIDGSARVNLGGLTETSIVEIDFGGSPVSAVGFDTVNYDINDEQAQAFLNGTTLIGNFPAARDQTGFIGVLDTSGASISSIAIRSGLRQGDVFNAFDNVSFSRNLQAVPEPTSLAVWAGISGLLVLRGSRVRRSHK